MKTKVQYVCQQCGATYAKWVGKCNSCGTWSSVVEEVIIVDKSAKAKAGLASSANSKSYILPELPNNESARYYLADPELNRVLGGGYVPGSVILLGGEPGIGKSTVLLQMALSTKNLSTLYVCGEESLSQIKLRASRLEINSDTCRFIAETNLETIIKEAEARESTVIVIDSIQTISSSMVEASAGSISQIRECSQMLISFAKQNDVTIFLIGHITKDGNIAGPKILEHMVDTVLYFEGDRHYNYRIIRSIKNRYGSVSELGIYEMGGKGLVAIENPSEVLISTQHEGLSGIAIAATVEGNRPMLVEVQALVSPSPYSTPQRTTTGFDGRRLSMLLAVLEKRCGLKLSAYDVFLNIAGGLKIEDPAIDAAVAAAIASSFHDIAIPLHTCFAAELGLSGELRPVSQIAGRVGEAAKLGFNRFILSSYNKNLDELPKDKIRIRATDTLQQTLNGLFKL